MTQWTYLNGLGSHLQSEALPNALPKNQNSPQRTPYGLYAEQLSGAAFTAPRHRNCRSWLYRIRPSVSHCSNFTLQTQTHWLSAPIATLTPPMQFRWHPPTLPIEKTDFIQGMQTLACNGNVSNQSGAAIHWYALNTSMDNHYCYNADGEMLIVPQTGELNVHTECGRLNVRPKEIVVIPRGMRFQINVVKPARGYVLENYGAPFRLPERGPIGANGLAEERHFQIPTAWYEQTHTTVQLTVKYNGQLWQGDIAHSPLDVVAWQGNYYPYKYDLDLFIPVCAVKVDHSDPSIFTVLTSPSTQTGVANIDFVIFPERWMTCEKTFRVPYYHRNIMSEFMGLIHGSYDAKADDFIPGGASLHNCMTPHGVDRPVYEQAIAAELTPEYYQNTLAFMFESATCFNLTQWAQQTDLLQKNYLDCWSNMPVQFSSDGLTEKE